MIVVDKLSKSYGEKNVLENISFHISEGECVGLIGLNGAGKTTLINILLGKLKASSGLVRVLQQDSAALNREALRKIGYVSGTGTQLWKNMRLRYSFESCAAMHNISDRDYKIRLSELCSALQISELLSSEPHRLSMGQRMRCELAYALLPHPKLLILDEATIGIDVAAKNFILQCIDNMRRQNHMTVIYAGHYLKEVEQLCERIIVLDHRAILFDGNLHKFVDEYGSFCTLKLKCDALPDLEDLPVEEFCIADQNIVIEFNKRKIGTAEIIRHIRQKCEIRDIKLIEPNLEDTIKKIYAREAD
ncbi:MAG: ATP-binding cassette domain-containing protein [Acutalibacteraceae bacterium]